MIKAKLFKSFSSGKVRCLACQRKCLISPGQTGFCQSRLNKNKKLYALTYGIVNGFQLDPIEKKPLYHFYPGTKVLSFGSYGCNYRCKQCLNYWCSWGEPAGEILPKLKDLSNLSGLNVNYVEPKEIIDLAIKQNVSAIAFTYNEPVIWPEFVYDTAKLAKKNGLSVILVTNGSWTKKALAYYGQYIDAVNIDIKGFYPQTYAKMGAFFGQILAITELAVKKYKLFTELTTLIIPGINDSLKELKAIASWIKKSLGADIPWHLSRFDPDLAPSPDFKKLPATPVKTLKKAYQIGKQTGLNYVYVWAPPTLKANNFLALGNSFCPKCGRLIVKRSGWRPQIKGIKKKKNHYFCRFCGSELNFKF